MARRKKARRRKPAAAKPKAKKPTIVERVRKVAERMDIRVSSVMGVPFGRGVLVDGWVMKRRTNRGHETWSVAVDGTEAWLVGLSLPEALEEVSHSARESV